MAKDGCEEEGEVKLLGSSLSPFVLRVCIALALKGIDTVFIKALEKATDTVLIDPEKMPLLRAWMDQFCKSEGVKKVMPDPAKELEIVSAGRAKLLNPDN